MTRSRKYWLLKTEPSSFSIDDLEASPQKTTCWDGVRNYQARNFIRDEMKTGDQALIYHSNAKPACVVGVARIVKEAYPDPTAWDPQDHHFDAKSDPAHPCWFMVDIKLIKKLKRPLPLEELRKTRGLENMELLRKGSRLSVQPVGEREFQTVLKLSQKTT